eukprot:Tbor_TRINITY_DN10175_c0_g1::TRINITY_DN10175_c0_g1_i1::g.17282::m.17282
MTGRTNRLGNFLLTRTTAKSPRQLHATGPQYYKRKFFKTNNTSHLLHKRISGRQAAIDNSPDSGPWRAFSHLPGDASRRPDYDYGFDNNREDGVIAGWRPRGSLQLFLTRGGAYMGAGKVFVCFRCGYPVKSKLVAIKDDNWDWRVCYSCYVQVVNRGQHERL